MAPTTKKLRPYSGAIGDRCLSGHRRRPRRTAHRLGQNGADRHPGGDAPGTAVHAMRSSRRRRSRSSKASSNATTRPSPFPIVRAWPFRRFRCPKTLIKGARDSGLGSVKQIIAYLRQPGPLDHAFACTHAALNQLTPERTARRPLRQGPVHRRGPPRLGRWPVADRHALARARRTIVLLHGHAVPRRWPAGPARRHAGVPPLPGGTHGGRVRPPAPRKRNRGPRPTGRRDHGRPVHRRRGPAEFLFRGLGRGDLPPVAGGRQTEGHCPRAADAGRHAAGNWSAA